MPQGFHEWVIVPSLLHMGIFYLVSAVFFLFDMGYLRSPTPQIQRTRVLLRDYKRVLPVALRNQLVGGLPSLLLLWALHTERAEPLNALRLLGQLVGCVLFEEVAFYWLHRLMHSPRFYAAFHKKHHEFTKPIGMSAIYCTVTEHVLVNNLPALLGPILLGVHCTSFCVWMSIVTLNTVLTHSNYRIPGFNAGHNLHHEVFDKNFGVLGILDRTEHTAL